jgi:hypothetical protein
MLSVDGFIQKVDRTQFVGFADEYWKFASVLRYPPNGEGVPQEVNEHCPSHDLLDESGRLHRGARLVFLESEIETAFGMAAEPAGEEAQDDVEAAFQAWLTAQPEHPRLKKEQARKNFNEIRRKFNRKTIGGRPFNRAWKESAPSSWHTPGRLTGT